MESTSKISQILKIFLIVALLVTPLLSTSLRSTYFYFLFNLLIVALGAEAGLLSFFSEPTQENKSLSSSSFSTPKISLISSIKDIASINSEEFNQNTVIMSALEKCSSTKIVTTNVKVQVLKKCPSTPSLFFIGGSDCENEVMGIEEFAETEESDHEEEVEVVLPSEQELFLKAETFIGNFYKQLKMQREDSWKNIHGIYHNTF